jgi:hypothetical protein
MAITSAGSLDFEIGCRRKAQCRRAEYLGGMCVFEVADGKTSIWY